MKCCFCKREITRGTNLRIHLRKVHPFEPTLEEAISKSRIRARPIGEEARRRRRLQTRKKSRERVQERVARDARIRARAEEILVRIPLTNAELPEWPEVYKKVVDFGERMPIVMERHKSEYEEIVCEYSEALLRLVQDAQCIRELLENDNTDARIIRKVKATFHPDATRTKRLVDPQRRASFLSLLNTMSQDVNEMSEEGQYDILKDVIRTIIYAATQGPRVVTDWDKTDEILTKAEKEMEEKEREWIRRGRWEEALRQAREELDREGKL